MSTSPRGLLSRIGPGILVAATGVGAGDLAVAAFAGGRLGVTIVWAVLVGAALKFLLNEGLARWQLVTGTTFLEGSMTRLGRTVQAAFLLYLIVWTYLVSMALMSACGVTAHALWPLSGEASTDKLVYGVLHSLGAVVLVWLGGYRLFEKVMSVCIGVMFVTVLATAVAMRPDWTLVLRSLLTPSIPRLDADGVAWTVGLIGGVGGTVTVLCYGYWIREEGRRNIGDLSGCRLDLALGYAMTALFGIAMVIIGASVAGETDDRGARLVVEIAEALQVAFGGAGDYFRWAFLIGAWGAVFSSLLGVWQSVPYLYCDLWRMLRSRDPRFPEETGFVTCRTDSWLYRGHMIAVALIPITGLIWMDFRDAMKVYSVAGALFVPMLAAALLALNGRRSLMGEHRNSRVTTLLLVGALALFALFGWLQVHGGF